MPAIIKRQSLTFPKPRPADLRRGLTLLELTAVIALLGVFVAVAAARLGPAASTNFRAGADARRLALDFAQAQRRAIATGENHYLEFTLSGGNAVGYTLYRRISGGGVQAVDSYRDFHSLLTVTTSHTQAEFTFDGTALASYQVDLVAPDRTWRATVVPVTGTAKVVEL